MFKVIKFKKNSEDPNKQYVVDVNGSEIPLDRAYKATLFENGEPSTVYYPIFNQDYQSKIGEIGVVKIDGILYLNTDIRLIWCHGTGQWEMRSSSILSGYYKKNCAKGKIKYSPLTTVLARKHFDGNQFYINNIELATSMGYTASKCDQYFYPYDKLSKDHKHLFNTIQSTQLNINTTHFADENNALFHEATELFKEYSPKRDYRTIKIANLMGDKTFGIEYESSQGLINLPIAGKLGLVPVIDGSIGRNNFEYATVVMQGVKGLAAIKDHCKTLKHFCYFNSKCALHVHIGNVDDSKLNVLALYALAHRLESEIYAIFPHYKLDERGVFGKKKEYSRPLPNMGMRHNTIFAQKNKKDFEREVDTQYARIWRFFSCGHELSEVYNRQNRKDKVRKGKIVKTAAKKVPWRNQWDCPTRYYWLNFINLMFNTSGTLEFRLHEPTFSFTKVSNWLLFCVAFVRYAENNQKKILSYRGKITLKDIFKEIKSNFGKVTPAPNMYYTQVGDYLKNYYRSREIHYLMQYTEAYKFSMNRNDTIQNQFAQMSREDFARDRDYKFEYKGMTEIY